MSPRWLIALTYLLLVTCPVYTSSQMVFVKTAFCVVWSASFVAANCAPCERLLCRILASRIKKFCRTFPCTNYGSPTSNKCTAKPFECFPWRIKPLGLCSPFKHCCHIKTDLDFVSEPRLGSRPDIESRLARTSKRTRPSKRLNSKFIRQDLILKNTTDVSYHRDRNVQKAPYGDELYHIGYLLQNQTRDVPMYQGAGVSLLTTPEEYLEDWPVTEDDAFISEEVIKQQYDKFTKEVKSINEDEASQGRKAVQIPSFEEFQSVAKGEISDMPW